MTPPYFKIRYRPHLAVAGNDAAPRALGHANATLRMDAQDAARYYLQEFFRESEQPEFRQLTGETRNNRAPDFRLVGVQEQSQLGSRIVKFIETRNSIPIYGSNLVVELGANQELMSITGKVTRVEGVDPIPKFTGADALERLKEFTDSSDWEAPAPEANFYYAPENKWHLVYLFRDVPATPHAQDEDSQGQSFQKRPFGQPRSSFEPRFNYLVDAHDGSIVDYFSERPAFGEATVSR
jgi:bacillolysin